MATKVIDALVVTLGLDPKGYVKGASEAKAAQEGLKKTATADATATQQSTEKSGSNAKKLGAERRKQDTEERKRQRQREREAREAQQQEQKHTDATIDRIKSVGLAAAGLVLGFNTVKGALQAYLGATSQLAGLGRLAPTIGADTKALDKLGDAYKQVGGKADEAGSDLAKLGHAQFSYAINNPDALAGYARRLGVGLFDKSGKARDKIEVQEDIARALKRQTSDLQTQAMYAREMGLSESFIQLYLVKSNSERKEILASAEKTAKATEAATAAAVKLDQALARAGNQLKGVGQNIVAVTSAGVAGALNALSSLSENAKPFKSSTVTPGRRKDYDAAINATAAKYGISPNLLAGVLHTESSFDPNAVARNPKTGVITGKGIAQLNPKYFPNAGNDPTADIDAAGKELARLYNFYRKTYPSNRARELALQAYNFGQGNLNRSIKAGGALPAETANYAPSVLKYAGQSADFTAPTAGSTDASSTVSHVTTTHIEQLNVHTQATDAQGIAAALPGAISDRQNTVSQADVGLR